MKYKLKDNHPTMIKIQQLNDKVEELGLSIDFRYGKSVVVEDTDFPDLYFSLEDLEGGNVLGLPLIFEYNLFLEVVLQDVKDWHDMIWRRLKERQPKDQCTIINKNELEESLTKLLVLAEQEENIGKSFADGIKLAVESLKQLYDKHSRNYSPRID